MMLKSSLLFRWALKAVVVMTVLLTTGRFLPPENAAGASLKGKMVRLIVNQPAGATTDVITRQVAPYIQKYLPGNPKVIVENEPGGRGALAASYMMNTAKPDGLSVGVFATIPARWALNADLPVDLSKFKSVGALATNSAMLVRTDEGYHSIEDLIKAKRQVVFGTASPFSANTIMPCLFFDAIGVKYKTIGGYRGQTKALQALISKEVNFVQLNSSVYLPKREGLEKENIVGILQWGRIDKDGTTRGSKKMGLETVESAWRRLSPDTVDSLAFKVFREILKIDGVFFLYVMPPDTPDELVGVWADAFVKAHRDKDYLAMVHKSGADDPIITEAETAKERLSAFRPFFERADVSEVLAPFQPK